MRLNSRFVFFHPKAVLSLFLVVSLAIGVGVFAGQQKEAPVILLATYDPRLTEWLVDYLDSVTVETDLYEVIYAILDYRQALISQGYTIPPVSQLMPYFKECLKIRGVDLQDDMCEFLQEKFLECEEDFSCSSKNSIEFCKHDKKKHKKDKKRELSFSPKALFGLIKVIGGTLTMLVPIPSCQIIGGGLVLNGIDDLLNDCRDLAKEDKSLPASN